ncbi:MAG: hypothetical protein Q9207_001682 [Kuettlingeria erythrocarpa]
MGNPLGAASVSGHDDEHQHANSSQAAENTAGALQELHIDNSSPAVGENRSFPGEGRTFTVDPKVFTQWNAGKPGIIDSDGAYGAHQATPSVAGQTNGAHSDSTEHLTVSTDALAAGAPTEGAPTGFEEFYVDAPMTPAEFEEEKGFDIDFSRRIEYAIQRFCARRNMDSTKKDIFDKYLLLGGISAKPKQFTGGLDAKDISDMDAAEIALMKATHFVDADKWGGNSAYEVDFETCAKAFFSSRVPWVYDVSGPDSVKLVKAKTNVIRNFLNYLLHHDVCPEYKHQILAARAVCDLTDKELPMVMKAQNLLPGNFQTACSEIFGGTFQGVHGNVPGWDDNAVRLIGMSEDLAKQTFRVGMSTHVSDAVASSYMDQNEKNNLTTARSYDTGLEITKLIPASAEVNAFYQQHPAAKGLKPLGQLVAKTWVPPYQLPRDLTEEEKADEEGRPGRLATTHNFLVEDYVLETCFVGMKLEVTVREMSFGLEFFDAVSAVLCSFYTLLPNELMLGWRIPEAEHLPYRKSNNDAGVLGEHIGQEEDLEEHADQQTGDAAGDGFKMTEAERRTENVPRIDISAG